VGGRRESELAPRREAVKSFIDEFSCEIGRSTFASVQVKENSKNLGTCKTCEVAMTYAFESHEFAIFTEDDGIFARDALIWFEKMRDSCLSREPKYWAIAGESIYFNAREKIVDTPLVEAAQRRAHELALFSKFVAHKFVPSTCFATTRDKWREFGQTRGQAMGDEDVCKRCLAEEKFCLFPVVPRVRDIGMLHDLGYSVMIHTKSGVRELKNTYLTSDMLDRCIDQAGFTPLPPDQAGLLYSQSSVKLSFD